MNIHLYPWDVTALPCPGEVVEVSMVCNRRLIGRNHLGIMGWSPPSTSALGCAMRQWLPPVRNMIFDIQIFTFFLHLIWCVYIYIYILQIHIIYILLLLLLLLYSIYLFIYLFFFNMTWKICEIIILYKDLCSRSSIIAMLSGKSILANLKIWCSKMQPFSGNQRPDPVTSLMNMSPVLNLPRKKNIFTDPLQRCSRRGRRCGPKQILKSTC